MKLTVQRKLASQLLNCSPSKVKFETSKLSEIKEAITKVDIRLLIKKGFITKKQENQLSRARARKIHLQKVKGKRKGSGSRKGPQNAREPEKKVWINRIRAQRTLIKELKDKKLISEDNYRKLYQKVKGGFFRNKRHIKLYIAEKEMLIKR